MLVRRIARPMLAAPFVVLGFEALKDPGKRPEIAQPVIDKITEAADRTLPVKLPKDPEVWVRVNGGVMTGAGALYGLGRLPRLSALLLAASTVPTTMAGHRFWEYDEPAQRSQQKIHFLKNLGLVGALLIAAVDTEGKPSVGWRARRAAGKATEATEKQLAKAQKQAEKVQKEAAKRAKDARKQAKKQAKKVTS